MPNSDLIICIHPCFEGSVITRFLSFPEFQLWTITHSQFTVANCKIGQKPRRSCKWRNCTDPEDRVNDLRHFRWLGVSRVSRIKFTSPPCIRGIRKIGALMQLGRCHTRQRAYSLEKSPVLESSHGKNAACAPASVWTIRRRGVHAGVFMKWHDVPLMHF